MKKLFIAFSSLLLVSCSALNFSANKKDADGFLSIKLNNSKVNLSLSEKQSFDDPKQTLVNKNTYEFMETTYSFLPAQEVLDNESTPYDYGAQTLNDGKKVMNYFKYTFYIKNTGDVSAAYEMKIGLKEHRTSDGSGRSSLSDTLRVMVFENDVDDDSKDSIHTTAIYAKESNETNYDKDGIRTRREFVASHPVSNQEDDEHPLANTFKDQNTIAEYKRSQFDRNQIVRYTFVIWLEGEDPESLADAQIPSVYAIQFSIDISAYGIE